jgi:hypothetical protein
LYKEAVAFMKLRAARNKAVKEKRTQSVRVPQPAPNPFPILQEAKAEEESLSVSND